MDVNITKFYKLESSNEHILVTEVIYNTKTHGTLYIYWGDEPMNKNR